MKKTTKTLAWGTVALALLLLNVQIAFAHQWWVWHWHTNTLHLWVYGQYWPQHVAAIQDWDSHVSDLHLHTNFKDHTDISVFDGNFGATGWWGLASIESYDFDWWHLWCWCKITHAHSRFNSYYGGTLADVQGVMCQEVGHTYGLDHSNTGDCMGKGYYNSINVTGPHNWSDINAMY